MKVVLDCVDFKRAVDKALAVAPKRSALPGLMSIHIVTDKDSVVISASNLESYVKVNVDARVLESGETYLDISDVKKVYSFSDTVTITVDDGKFTVSNSKKKSSVFARDYKKVFPDFPEEDENTFMKINGRELADTLAALECFSSQSDANKMMHSYYFDGVNKRIVAIDGHRIGIRKLPDEFISEVEVIIPNNICPHIKKIVTDKHDDIKVKMLGKKFVAFEGKDFTYITRVVAGSYFDINGFFSRSCKEDFTFKLNPKELRDLSREYKRSMVGTNTRHMLIEYNKDDMTMTSGVMLYDFRSADRIESFTKPDAMSKDFTYGLDAEFVESAMNLFEGEVSCSGSYNVRTDLPSIFTPLLFSDDKYIACLLPIQVSREDCEGFHRYISAA